MTIPEISAAFPFESRYVDVLGSRMHYVEEGMEALGYEVLGRLLEDPIIACLCPQLQLGGRFTAYVE